MWMKLEGRKFFSRLFSHQWITWEWESELWGAKKWLQIKACIISRCCFCPSSKVLGCIASHNFSILFHFFFNIFFPVILNLSLALYPTFTIFTFGYLFISLLPHILLMRPVDRVLCAFFIFTGSSAFFALLLLSLPGYLPLISHFLFLVELYDSSRHEQTGDVTYFK